MRRILVIWALTAATFHQPALSQEAKQEFHSPDDALIAIIVSTKPTRLESESSVEVVDKSGKILARKDYSSEDGSHGYGVMQGSWTPDSQFFVYSLGSSGGHSPWHSPVQFFNRRDGKIVSLDDALKDAVVNPQFRIAAPDKVTVELYFLKKEETVSLSSVGK